MYVYDLLDYNGDIYMRFFSFKKACKAMKRLASDPGIDSNVLLIYRYTIRQFLGYCWKKFLVITGKLEYVPYHDSTNFPPAAYFWWSKNKNCVIDAEQKCYYC